MIFDIESNVISRGLNSLCAHVLTVTERRVCLIKLTGLGRCSGICFSNNVWLMLWEIVQKKKKRLVIKCVYT